MKKNLIPLTTVILFAIGMLSCGNQKQFPLLTRGEVATIGQVTTIRS